MENKQKVAVVTGASKGIGRAVAERLLQDGFAVVACARTEKDLKKAVKQMERLGEVKGVVCDMRDEKSVRKMLDKCVKSYGGVDVLVNNAGVGIIGQTVEEMKPKDFEKILQTNVFGVYYACHHAIPLMKERGGGYIFTISSLAGQNAHPKMAAYNASKFGVNGFTEALMQEVRPDNIKVTLICPGSVNTYFGGGKPSEERAWQIQPEDIAQTVADLLAMNPRVLPSKVEMRPAKPPVK